MEVTTHNTETGAERKTKTNEVGLYTVPLLQPGVYDVRVQHQGFRPVLQSGIRLDLDQRGVADFVLQVGALSEQIDVRASVSKLNTVEASQGQVIDNQRIVDMPLNRRSFLDLALMSGGAVQATPGSRIGSFLLPDHAL